MSQIKWAYALNQWKPQFDDFVRREDHARALKTISIAGFTGVELPCGTGRWEPMGNPDQLIANFGSLAGFQAFLTDCAVDSVSSWYFDPLQRSMEDLTPSLSPLVAADRDAIVERTRSYAAALAQLGGAVLVVAATPPAGDITDFDDAVLADVAECWNAVGRATSAYGIRTALHIDFLSPLREAGALDRLLELTDPAVVGLTVDTGELTVAGLDPSDVIRKHADRVWHVHFKDALATDEAGEYRQPHAEYSVRQRGGTREIPRWFGEPGVHGGLVDFDDVASALADIDYSGWVVFESNPSPHPATSALLGGYFLQRRMQPALSSAPASSR